VAALLLLVAGPAARAAEDARAYVFWREGCPHCERLLAFLNAHVAAQPGHEVRLFEVGRDPASRDLLVRLATQLGADRIAVPFTVVGERWFIGFLDDATSGAQIVAALTECRTNGCRDVVAPLLAQAATPAGTGQTEARTDQPPSTAEVPATPPPAGHPPAASGQMRPVPPTLDLPLLGRIETSDLSLPLLTVALAALDGFNPCAMWTLLFLIGLLLGMQDRVRMWVLGGVFLAASGAVYYLFMAAWLNALLALGMVGWIRAAVGLLALVGGCWYLREFLLDRGDVCVVTAPEHRRRVFERLKSIALERRFWLAAMAMVALAFVVNLVELVCSAGIPAVYTQVLALTPLPAWQYYGYLALYIVVFMLDDLFVFVVAMTTLQATGLTARYARGSHLVGGLVLIGIGILLVVRPEWLIFG